MGKVPLRGDYDSDSDYYAALEEYAADVALANKRLLEELHMAQQARELDRIRLNAIALLLRP